MLEEDVKAAIPLGDNIELVKGPGPGITTVTVSQAQWEVRQKPQSRRSVTVGYDDVDVFTRVFLLPDNATVLFDVVEDEISIDYAFEIQFSKAGAVPEKNLCVTQFAVRAENARTCTIKMYLVELVHLIIGPTKM